MAKDFSDWRSAKGRNSLTSIALDMADYMEERFLVKNLNKTKASLRLATGKAWQAGSPGKNTKGYILWCSQRSASHRVLLSKFLRTSQK